MPVDVEPLPPRRGDRRADAVDPGQLLLVRLAQGLQGSEARRQRARRRRADVAHRQGHQHPPQRPPLGGVQLGEHGGGVLARRRRPLDLPVPPVALLGPEEAGQAPVPGGPAARGHRPVDHHLAQVLHVQLEQARLAGEDRRLLGQPGPGGQGPGGVEELGGVQGPALGVGQAQIAALGLQDAAGGHGRQRVLAPGVGLGQGGGRLVPEPLDVQRPARADVGDPLGQLGGARARVGAAQVDVALLGGGEPGPARGARLGHVEAALGAVAGLDHRGDDLGDDVARLAQHDRVPDEHPLAGDLGGVVEGGAGHRGAGHQDRLHDPEGRHPAGAPHLDVDVQQTGVDLLGRVLVGGRPPGHAGGVAELCLQEDRVELEDDAVDLVDEVVAVLGVAGDEGLPLGPAAHDGVVGGHGQAPVLQQAVPLVEQLRQLLPRRRGDRPDAVGDEGQGAGGGDGGVLLAQGPGGGVAGVGEDLQQRAARGLPLDIGGAAGLVEVAEGPDGEVDLAAHLQQRRVGVAGQDQRHGGDGPHIAGHVLPRGAVPAGGCPGEHAVLVGQGDRQAVDLDLGGHGQLVVGHARLLGHARRPLLDLLQAEDVPEGVHALVVGRGGEVGDGPAADAARGRGGQRQGGVGGLELLQLAVEPVVLGVGHGRLGVDGVVVGVAGALDDPDQVRPPLAGGGGDGDEVGGRLVAAHGPILPHACDTIAPGSTGTMRPGP